MFVFLAEQSVLPKTVITDWILMLLVLLLLRLRDDDMTICFAVLRACSIK